jgi:hypothetical protein
MFEKNVLFKFGCKEYRNWQNLTITLATALPHQSKRLCCKRKGELNILAVPLRKGYAVCNKTLPLWNSGGYSAI